jgi:hypothetical protein
MRPPRALPAAYFDRNERYAYFGDRTLARIISDPEGAEEWGQTRFSQQNSRNTEAHPSIQRQRSDSLDTRSLILCRSQSG